MPISFTPRLVITIGALTASVVGPMAQPASAAQPVGNIIDVSAPREVAAGQRFQMEFRARNPGQPAIKSGSITVSFPDTYVDARTIGSTLGPGPFGSPGRGTFASVVDPGFDVFDFRRGANSPASRQFGELYIEGNWPLTELRFLRLELTAPPNPTSLRTLIRVTVRTPDDRFVHYPPSSAYVDQQGAPAMLHEVPVRWPPTNTPTTRPTIAVPTATSIAPPTHTAVPAIIVITPIAPDPAKPSGPPSVRGPVPPPSSDAPGGSSLTLLMTILAAAGGVAAMVALLSRRPATPVREPRKQRTAGQPSRRPSPPPSQPPFGTPPPGSPYAGGPLQAGSMLAGYRIVGSPKSGGMGTVYRAEQVALARSVALKVLAPVLGSDPSFVQRFEEEARRTASLDHPNIVTVYDSGQANGLLFIAMRYVDGVTLEELLAREGMLPLPRAIHITAQLGEALDYAHRRGIFHRDVKPSNVMVEPGDRVTLTDFGIAKLVDGTQLTRAGAIIGTPDYLSPEQGAGQEIDARSDLYSLGVVLYEMVTGRTPFRADTPVAVVHAHIYTPPPSPAEVNRKLPPSVASVIVKALAKDPGRRYQTGRDLVAALRKASERRTPKTKAT